MFLISTVLSCLGCVFPYAFAYMDFLAIKLLPPIVCHSSSLGRLASEPPSLRVASAGDAKR